MSVFPKCLLYNVDKSGSLLKLGVPSNHNFYGNQYYASENYVARKIPSNEQGAVRNIKRRAECTRNHVGIQLASQVLYKLAINATRTIHIFTRIEENGRPIKNSLPVLSHGTS